MKEAEVLDPEGVGPTDGHDPEVEPEDPYTQLTGGAKAVDKTEDATEVDGETPATESCRQVWEVKHLLCLLL